MSPKWMKLCLLFLLAAWLPLTVEAEELPFQDGDRVVIWSEDAGVALSTETDNRHLSGVKVSVEEAGLTGYGETEIWTAAANGDGSWRFENNGGVLSLDEKNRQLTLDGTYSRWELSDGGDGFYRLYSPDAQRYITCYSARGVFAAAKETSGQTALSFYVLPDVPESPEPTETPEETAPARPDLGPWQLYFGQLHAHTADSDGAGTVAEAYAQAEAAGLDFFGVTDHSDSFDHDEAGLLDKDGSAVSHVWAAGKAAAEAASGEDFVALYGFEMSWNQGQGHISTFGTPGFLSRDAEAYQNYSHGLERYLEALTEVPGSVSQFNHPGTLYGNFKDFSLRSPRADRAVSLIEVGNGTGSEYTTYYDAYTQALDAGWHLAPTNNHNNHNGGWGTAGSGRTVVLAQTLTEAELIDALRSRRVYATEDGDLEILYTLNGAVMGTELRAAQVPAQAELAIILYDPTDGYSGTVEVITEGGAVAASAPAAEQVAFSLPSHRAYYYIRVTQGDGDIAVTAPVWIRQRDDVGISRLETGTALTRAGEPQSICLELSNNEQETLTVTSLELLDAQGSLLWEQAEEWTVAQFDTKTAAFTHCFETDGVYSLTVRVSGSFAGEPWSAERTLEVTVLPAALTSQILLDGTHGGGGDYAQLLSLAAQKQISARVEEQLVTQEQLAACSLLVIPAPTVAFEEAFLESVKSYVNSNGTLLLLGTAGGSEELNRLLAYIGSGLSLNADTAWDAVSNGGAPDQLYSAVFGTGAWTEGLLEGQVFAHISGCTVTGGNWLVQSGSGERLLTEAGDVILAGSDFLQDRYLQQPQDPWALPYANLTILENILGLTRSLPQLTPIGELRQGEPGRIYWTEGWITAGTANPNTTFSDTVYLQDDTGAIAAVGYSTHGLELGRRVRVLGSLRREGEVPSLEILELEIIEKEEPLYPELTETGALDYAKLGDRLLQLQGTVTEVTVCDGVVESFLLKDDSGGTARVWVEPYIRSGSLGWNPLQDYVKPGNRVSAVGLCHWLAGETVLRVRDCDEVVLLWAPSTDTGGNPDTGDAAFPGWAMAAMILSLAALPAAAGKRKTKERGGI